MIEWGMLVNNVEISFCSGGLIIFFFWVYYYSCFCLLESNRLFGDSLYILKAEYCHYVALC